MIIVVKMGDAGVGDSDGVNSMPASACHLGGPKDVSPGQKALRYSTVPG